MKLKKSSFLTKLIVLIVVVYATVTLVSLQTQISAKQTEGQALSQIIAATEQENQRLQNAIDTMDTEEGIEEIARQKLGLVSQGEIVFHDVGN